MSSKQFGSIKHSTEREVQGEIMNFSTSIHFPHEVGLFLGYPLEDVIGFISNKGENYYQVGPWKVYSDQETAVKKFEKFKKCTMIYKRLFSEGKTLQQLAVSV